MIFYLVITPCYASANSGKTAHIYIDLATLPALLQMADAVKQPQEDPKLFIWKRFKPLDARDELLQTLNAKMVDTQFLSESNYDLFIFLVNENLKNFYNKYRDHSFIIHLNAVHIPKSGDVFDIIPENQIKTVHLYEDAIGISMWYKYMLYPAMGFIHKLPTYMHLGHYNLKNLAISEDKIITFNFQNEASKLSESQKQMVAKLVGLDMEKVKKIFQHRPVAVFLDDPRLDVQSATSFVEFLIKTHGNDITTYNWIYKNHPRITDSTNFELIKKFFPNTEKLDNQIPLEVLILTGYTPDYIAGYGTSVFYSFDRPQILGYIKRFKDEIYMKYLRQLGKITPDIIYIKKDEKTQKSKFSGFIEKINNLF